MPVITLLTDFGLKDGYVGAMKGVIWSIAPEVQIADLSHAIAPQNILQGALVLERTAGFFPAGTVHIAVVDPGVGTYRRPIAARLGSHTFVGPDNGLFSRLLARARQARVEVEIVHLDQPQYWLPQVSRVFHGRDIFAPVGAHLAKGTALHSLGTLINDPVLLDMPAPEKTADGWRGAVIDIDAFGNLQTNLRQDHLTGLQEVVFGINGLRIDGLSLTFGDRPSGEIVAMLDSAGYLSIAMVNGDAARHLPAAVGDPIEVRSHAQ